MKLLIKLEDILVEYNGQEVLNIHELELYDYEKVGIVGVNGSGKTTLMKIMLEDLKPDQGKVYKDGEFSYVSQVEAYKNVDSYNTKKLFNIDNKNSRILSGGEEIQLKISDALSENSHAIFADEPTSFLDIESKDKLIDGFKYYPGACVIISHDRYFLDEVVSKIWEVDNGVVTEYYGNYSDYLEQKEIEKISQKDAVHKILKEQEEIKKSIENKRSQVNRLTQTSKKKKQKNKTNDGGRLSHQKSQGSKEKRIYREIKELEKRLETLNDVNKYSEEKPFVFRQEEGLELYNRYPITGRNINKTFEDKVIFEDTKFDVCLNKKVAVIGSNGSGKSTLFKMIVNKEEGISLAPSLKIGYFKQDAYKFDLNQTVIEFIAEESHYNYSELRSILASMGFYNQDINKPLTVLSGGERVKLHLTKILCGHYNLLILDEPTNFLDIKGVEAIESLMIESQMTILFTSHDKRLIENVADVIYEIKDNKLIEV